MKFRRIPDPANLPANLKNSVVAIGNFDGVHRGHQSVLQEALNKARKLNVPAIVLTFEPHPRTFFKPDQPVFRLTDAYTKARLVSQMGFDAVIEHTFNAAFAGTSAGKFVEDVLAGELGASHVVTGYDFHFGKGREGSPAFLSDAGKKYGFGVTIIEAFSDEGGETISSSRVRDSLALGDVAMANGLLGYAFRTRDEVIKGKQLGRELGYPTANVALPAECTLRHGIYAVRAMTQDGVLHDGVASYGRRPTFDNGEALLETFLFDFTGEIYGEILTVCLYGWLRGEEKFDSTQTLIAQMDKDCVEAKAVLAAFGPEQGLWPTMHDD